MRGYSQTVGYYQVILGLGLLPESLIFNRGGGITGKCPPPKFYAHCQCPPPPQKISSLVFIMHACGIAKVARPGQAQ